ncbi:polyprenyl synthetase family protein [Methanosphaerula palustris]|uniref:Polyprenyl synthetase n=1 Tax=Methanosphaerula palustris (strain ATCC BAA-1556 / DSM 19958 / E1-9c) TaxID=521011 RepID=B8GEF2_METPE|nr:polyprenyl synthetase family protein [Methanosphaerula palustris]ACL17653.1 Polyprenyl synthetase [Methanosphaerula palustris E1-9c]
MELIEYLEKVGNQVDRLIDRYFGDPVGELNKASAHLLTAGGKRLRPAVMMLAADAVRKGSSDDLMPAAIALELTHSFTLIHDDIMDGDEVRRGVPTVNKKWDEPTAILAGDVLYARAFAFICQALAMDAAKLRAVSMLAVTCEEICAGQHLDMAFEDRDDVSEEEYLEMVGKKTGALYAASTAMGGVLAGGSQPQVDALYRYGMNIGVAFQIQDDLIDLLASPERSGKDRASDIREGKQTLINIKAREHGFDLAPYRRRLDDAEIDDLIQQLTDNGVIGEVKATAEGLVTSAGKILAILKPSDEKDLLISIGTFFVERGY